METVPSHQQYEIYVADLAKRLADDGWSIGERRLDALGGVLPPQEDMLHAAVVTDTRAAFVVGESLLIATWSDDGERLTTTLLLLAHSKVTVDWNAAWLSDFSVPDRADPEQTVPERRPVTVTVTAPDGEAHVLPFDEAWHNEAGCIGFAATLIEVSRGFRPGIATPYLAPQQRWKR